MLKLLFDFTDLQAVNAWHAIDDRVMGGISQSRLKHEPASHAVFEGEVSLEQNGGFASVRSKPGDRGHPGAQALTSWYAMTVGIVCPSCSVALAGAPKPPPS